jgi:transposase-like protein
MKASATDDRKTEGSRHPVRQRTLFPFKDSAEFESHDQSEDCIVVAVGKRRDGGTRYWCLRHKADATAKYGKPAKACRAAHIAAPRPEEVLLLDIDRYKGGIALWGAVPAVYDTTRLPMDRGIHVHARLRPKDKKEMDCTYRAIRLVSGRLPKEGILVSELDATYYMVSSLFGFQMRYVTCPYCDWPHLDKDWFSVHPHRRHLCAGCGKQFSDTQSGVGNPIMGVRDACGVGKQETTPSKLILDIKQSEFPNGIQIWGSNAAFLWTRACAEEEGIHVHAFGKDPDKPELDETYGRVTIDGIDLDPTMVRVLMAQSALPSLKSRVRSMDCPSCGEPQFSDGEGAFTPAETHRCVRCGKEFPGRSRFRKTILNPLPRILERLAKKAPREPQKHSLDLLPETL